MSELPGLSTQNIDANNTLFDKIEKIVTGPFVDFFWSIAVLTVMIKIRKDATPDFFGFMANLEAEEANFIWIMFLWIVFKCSLRLDDSTEQLLSSNQKI